MNRLTFHSVLTRWIAVPPLFATLFATLFAKPLITVFVKLSARRLATLFTLTIFVSSANANLLETETSTPKSIAFFYGANPPVNVLSQFDRLVLEPENVNSDELLQLKRGGAVAYSYLSIGEVGEHRNWFDRVPQGAVAGTNGDWNSKLMNLSDPAWQRFVLQRASELALRGYDGLFLDTMDSYQLFAKTDTERQEQEAALTNLVYRIKRKYPQLSIITNRGFEVIDRIGTYIDAVAAESLYAGWNNGEQVYTEVPEADRQWLQQKFQQIKRQFPIDTIAIDYVPPNDRSKARTIAAKISADGSIPWIANPSLDYIGISNLEVIPREVLMIYDSRVTGPVEEAEVHTLLATPLEYMGYVPVYHDIARYPLPQQTLKGAYAGIVIWNRTNSAAEGYDQWLLQQFDDTTPVALLGTLGTPLARTFEQALGIRAVGYLDSHSLSLVHGDELVGFEADIPQRIRELSLPVLNVSKTNSVHLSYADNTGTESDTVFTGPWGGMALHPTIIEATIDGHFRWVIDPFTFLRKSLNLIDAPMPDITSENGKRLWFAHIDGDALPSWAELPGRRLGAQVIRDEILEPYNLPHTISVVEAELNGLPQFADRRKLMVKTAREIFAMDSVEIASHTFSHPYKWQKIKPGIMSGRYNLPVKDYRYNVDREIGGSVKYIDSELAPPGKKTEVLLWSGDAIPLADALDAVKRIGLVNMNGGNTVITRAKPTVALVTPNVRDVDGRLQIYAPIMNENIYTNEWTGPFDGFRRVIETLELTDKPRRLKPANVYYHFYAGTKKASLQSLYEIYDWSVEQDIYPIYASEYIVKVPHFRTAGVARHLDGRWKVSGLGPIRSLRIFKRNNWPTLKIDSDIIGSRLLHDGMYLHTNGADSISFKLQSTRSQRPHLIAANARISRWQLNENNIVNMKLSGHVPVQLVLSGNTRFCEVTSNDTVIKGVLTEQGNTRYSFPTRETGDAVIDCQT